MKRLTPDARDLRFLRRLFLVAVAALVALYLYRVADLLLLAFGGLLGAVVLTTVANWLAERTPLSRSFGLVVAILLMLGLFGAIGWLFGAETARQAGALAHRLPEDWGHLLGRLETIPGGKALIDSGRAGAGGSTVALIAARAGWGVGEILVNLFVVLIAAIFFAVNPRIYRTGIVLLAPPPYRPPVGDALDDVVAALRLWLLTQIISMALMGAMIAFGLRLSGLSSWGALGVLGGLSEFIPYVGPTLAMIPALVVALAGDGSIWGVIATYALVRLVQANIITPLISQRVVHIPPGLYIFAILSVGATFGGFGMFFSGALAVAGFTLVRSLYLRDTLGDAVPPVGE